MAGVIAGLALVIPAVASANCVTNNDPTRTPPDSAPYAVGWLNNDPSGNYDFVDANILVRNPDLAPSCSTYHCGSYAWDMMATNDGSRWAQYGPFSGWYDKTGTLIGPGADYEICESPTGYYDKYVTTSTVGTSPHYRIHYATDPDGNPNNKIFVKGSTVEDWCGGRGGNEPFQFVPTSAQAADEVDDIQTQLPGNVNNHEEFTSATVTDPSSGTTDYFGRGGLKYTQQNTWMGQLPDTVKTAYEFWDKDCS